MPSAAFSMSLIPPMGSSSAELSDAVKRLSATKYGHPRAGVEEEIFARLGAGDQARKRRLEAMKASAAPKLDGSSANQKSFLDEWLEKRKQIVESSKKDILDNQKDVTNDDRAEKKKDDLNEDGSYLKLH